MECSLGREGTTQREVRLRIDSDRVAARPGPLRSALRIPLEADPFGLLVSLEGWIRTPASWQSGGGLLIPSQLLGFNRQYVDVPLNAAQLQALEAVRNGGPLNFTIEFAGLARLPASDGSNSTGLETIRNMGGAPDGLTISREHWLSLLKQMGWDRLRLVELPRPVLPYAQQRWTECLRLLEEAMAQHQSQQPEAAMATCRRVVEGVVSVLAEHWGIGRERGKPIGDYVKELGRRLQGAWPQDKEAGPLLASLYAASLSWTSPSHHYGSGIPVAQEASFALGLCADLVCLGGYLVEAHPDPVAAAAPGNSDVPRK